DALHGFVEGLEEDVLPPVDDPRLAALDEEDAGTAAAPQPGMLRAGAHHQPHRPVRLVVEAAVDGDEVALQAAGERREGSGARRGEHPEARAGRVDGHDPQPPVARRAAVGPQAAFDRVAAPAEALEERAALELPAR